MENNQMLPFERNRYYVGKLLTSADFQAEQTYGNHKRCFLNGMMFGSGIVCGLGVYSLDDLSIMVDSGVAIDGRGREIAVESPVVRKLSAVDGFEELATERATLCLQYREEDVHPVYTVRGGEDGEDYECNRIREGWRLFLSDTEALPRVELPDPEFLATAKLYGDEDYEVVCAMPAQSPCGAAVRLDVTVRRLRDAAAPLTLRAELQTPAFTNEDGDHALSIELLDLCPDGEVTLHYYLTAQTTPSADSILLADGRAIHVLVGGSERPAGDGFTLRSGVVALSAPRIIDQAIAAAGLEQRAAAGGQDYVPLAEIVLQRTRNAYLIEEVRTDTVRRYIRTAAAAETRQTLEGWFRPPVSALPGTPEALRESAAAKHATAPLYATGVCEIPLGNRMRRGQVAYSDEIIHGLGSGTVFVSVGVEYLADDTKLGVPARNTVYGDVSLFGRKQMPVSAETAVKVMNDRGSFVVAARMREDSTQVVLPLRWVAMLMPSGEENTLQKLADKSIAAVQPTVVMGTRESHYFNVRFNNMEPCTLTYELLEKDSGEITSDGIYTAPGREGVFEIRISCAEQPLISTYAYAVVKKKDVREDAEG